MTRRNVQPTLPGLGNFGVKTSLLCYQDYFFSKFNSFLAKRPGGVVNHHTRGGFFGPVLTNRIVRGIAWPLHL